MHLSAYIASRYGTERGATADFLRDNPHIVPQTLNRYKKAHKVNLITGEIYLPSETLRVIKLESPSSDTVQPNTGGFVLYLSAYIVSRYGTERGATADFLRDNPHIIPQTLNRYKKSHQINLITGDIYLPSATLTVIKLETPSI